MRAEVPQLPDLVDRQWAEEIETLHLVAAVRAQEIQLLRALHTLRQHSQVQDVAQRDDGLDDGCVIGILIDVADERLVDFESVNRKALQIVETAIARAEV